MSVDKLRQQTKEFSREPILEIESFLFSIQDQVKGLELGERDRRSLNFAYHRSWSFKDRLIKKYFPDGDSFTKQEPHIYPEHRLSAEQDVKVLLKNNSKYRDSILIPEVLKQDSENTIKFLKGEQVSNKTEENKLHLELNGDFWYVKREDNCYPARGKQLTLLRFLVDNPGAHSCSDLVKRVGINTEQQAINKVGILIIKIKTNLGLNDVIVKGEDGNGYRMSPKYDLISKTS